MVSQDVLGVLEAVDLVPKGPEAGSILAVLQVKWSLVKVWRSHKQF